MANINLGFEVAFHGLKETTSLQLASVPAPQLLWPSSQACRRSQGFDIFSIAEPGSCHLFPPRRPGERTQRRGTHESTDFHLLGALGASSSIHSQCQGDRGWCCQRAFPVPTKVHCLSSPLLSLAHTHTALSPAVWLLASTSHCLRVSRTPLLGWLFTHLAPSHLPDLILAFPLGTKLVIITLSIPCWPVALPS